jgi:hypothetical protein
VYCKKYQRQIKPKLGISTKVSPVEVRNILKNLHFPSKKQNLIQQAMKHGASREVIRVLESLPDKEYINAADLTRVFEGKKYVSKEVEGNKISTSTRL